MRILIIGGTGMLGHKLVQVLDSDPALDVFCTIRKPFASVKHFGIFDRDRTIDGVDVTDREAIEDAVRSTRPAVIVNAAGIVKQSGESSDEELMRAVNTYLPHVLRDIATASQARLITVSTDCVFSGKKGAYSEKDVPDAHDAYGISKRDGEVNGPNCLILRTSIIGRELVSSHGLVEWFLSNRGGRVSGYTRAVFSGFPTIVFADIVKDVIKDHVNLSGICHVSSDRISKFDLLRLLNDSYHAEVRIDADESVVIDRSLDSSRFRAITGYQPLPWSKMVEKMAADETPYDTYHAGGPIAS